ncbi:MAG TPA: DUF2851 family protein, partial [Chitinophagaceae bacterium]|nr:DUF2851 family protein [Chitinophagaceae bacterium]
MNEKLLQFIWQFQYFNRTSLATVDGAALQIIHPGNANSNQGPDFLEAKIKIDNTTLIGNIELHVKASDWYLHQHVNDDNYKNIILHVVWLHDKPVANTAGNIIPALELQPLVPKILLQHYTQLMQAKGFVPCENYLPVLSHIGWLAWKERLVAERLQKKAQTVLEKLALCNHHWEEVFWWLLAGNFGIKVNADLFEDIARSIPVNILAKHKNQIHQLEALLLGQALLLNKNFDEDYPKLLQREYRFLASKYKLKPAAKSPHFLRMRPANFPTVRLAQLAALIQQSVHLFSKMLAAQNTNEMLQLLQVTANDYWHYHYIFDEAAEYKPKQLGRQMAQNIIINTVAPAMFAY